MFQQIIYWVEFQTFTGLSGSDGRICCLFVSGCKEETFRNIMMGHFHYLTYYRVNK